MSRRAVRNVSYAIAVIPSKENAMADKKNVPEEDPAGGSRKTIDRELDRMGKGDKGAAENPEAPEDLKGGEQPAGAATAL